MAFAMRISQTKPPNSSLVALKWFTGYAPLFGTDAVLWLLWFSHPWNQVRVQYVMNSSLYEN